MMNPRLFATFAVALYGTIFFAWLAVAWPVGFGSTGIENTGAVPIEDRRMPLLSANAEIADAPQPIAGRNTAIAKADVATATESVTGTAADTRAASDQTTSIAAPALPESLQMLPPESPTGQVAGASTPDPARNDGREAVSSIESAPQATAMGSTAVAKADGAMATESMTGTGTDTSAASDAPKSIVVAALPDSAQMPPNQPPPVQMATVATPDPVPDDTKAAVSSTDGAPQPIAMGNAVVASADVASTAESSGTATDTGAASDQPKSIVVAALPDAATTLPPESPPVQVASASTSDPMQKDAKEAVDSVEILDECFVVDPCIDRYLWALYQRTPKMDSIKEQERRKVTVKRKGKTVTVTRSFTKLVDEDFAWKDPKAAEQARMTMMDYVIGGMDRGFKLKLFHVLHAAEEAGLSPGITSAFRDDYRQSIASGLKAATDRSYHGGSFRGGYGHGLAADIVSVKGATRAQRWISTESFWKWIDEHGKEFGIGRPYLDRDPPHVAPIDGKEYADHHGGAKAQHAEADAKKRKRLAVRDDHGAAKTPKKRKVVEGAKSRTI